MEIKKFKHTNVSHEGAVKDGGAVVTTGSIRMSQGEGCGQEGCHCSEGRWITICMPRTKDGIVEGIKAKLSKEEMDSFLKDHKVDN